MKSGLIPAVAALMLLAWPAISAPPLEGSEDWQRMQPYGEWVRSQNSRNGGWCCDGGDGRPVESDIRTGKDGEPHYFAHITPAHFPGLPDEWIEIADWKIVKPKPEDVRLKRAPGFSMVWMNTRDNTPYCFWPGYGD